MDEDLVGNQIIRKSSLNPLGRSLVRLGLRAQRLESALRMVEFGGPDADGRGPCPACSRFPQQQHDEACFLAEALRHQDPITHAEEAIRYVRGLVRDQQHSLELEAGRVRNSLLELQTTLDEVARILGQL